MSEALQKGPDEKFCSECGSIIRAKAEICPKCGVRQASIFSSLASVAPNGKSKLAAALFAFFLGGFGIHKFYLKQVGMGVLCTCSFAGPLFRPSLASSTASSC